MKGVVLRADMVEATLTTRGEFNRGLGVTEGPHADPAQLMWVVAVAGQLRGSSGILPSSACGLFALEADSGNIVVAGPGVSMAKCAPYFTTPFLLPDVPVTCRPEPDGYAAFDRFQFSRTLFGPVPISISRDDGWTQPATAPGLVLAEIPERSAEYYDTFCRIAHSAAVPGNRETAMLLGLGSPRVAPPPGLAQIWLKDVHAIEATASEEGIVTVRAEPRPGFEIVSYDWHALAPDGGYVKFRFIGGDGEDLIPYVVANGP